MWWGLWHKKCCSNEWSDWAVMFLRRVRITSAAVPCLPVENGSRTRPPAVYASTSYTATVTTSASPRYSNFHWTAWKHITWFVKGNFIPFSKIPHEKLLSGSFELLCKSRTDVFFFLFFQISKLPKVLGSASQLCFSSGSSHLFSASTQSSVHMVSLSQSECKFVATFKTKSGERTTGFLLWAAVKCVETIFLASMHFVGSKWPINIFQWLKNSISNKRQTFLF